MEVKHNATKSVVSTLKKLGRKKRYYGQKKSNERSGGFERSTLTEEK